MSLPGETYITTTHSLRPEIAQCDPHTLIVDHKQHRHMCILSVTSNFWLLVAKFPTLSLRFLLQ